MKLTKFEHSCMVLEKEGKSLVIDPGGLNGALVPPINCVAVVVTHEHFDHLNQDKLKEIFAVNPEAKLYVNEGIAAKLEDELSGRATVVNSGQLEAVEGFSLQFVGALHEAIRPEVPRPVNVGVIVDELFFHPGDEYSVPEQPFVWLGLAINAPWAKVSETNDFVKAAKSKHVIPIHDGLLNEAGIGTYENHITAACEMVGSEYHTVSVGESIELNP